LYVVASLCIPSVSKLPQPVSSLAVYLIENLLFLPGIFPLTPLITVTWSLSYEFLFYLCVPILIGATGMRRQSRATRVRLLVGILLTICIANHWNAFSHVRLGLFLAGALLREATETRGIQAWLSIRGEFLAIAGYVTALIVLVLFEFSGSRIAFNPHFPNRNFVYWTAFLSLGLSGLSLYTISYRGLLQSFFNAMPLRWLGNMSYTYFLCHGLILHAVSFVLHHMEVRVLSPFGFSVLLTLNLILTLGGSLVLFLLVEKPFSLIREPISVVPAGTSPAGLPGQAVRHPVRGETVVEVVTK
jgi:exopolysaccharide production protein ExoZ